MPSRNRNILRMLWGASLWVAYDVAVYSIWAVSGAAAFLVGSLIYYFPAVSGAVIDAVIAVLIATVGYNLARFVRRTKLIIESYGGGLSDIERAIERLPSLVAVRQRSERDLYQAKLDELRRAATQAVTGGLELVASATRGARISDAHSGELIITLPMHEISVLSAAFSPDGERIVTALLDRTARIWDARSGQPIAILQGHQGAVESAAFSPDGERIVTASWDNTARIWDARSSQPITTLQGHEGEVPRAAFSPDGTRIVTASWDRTARIWDARSGQPIATLQGHEDSVRSAAFSPDGAHIVTSSDDLTARIWNARNGERRQSDIAAMLHYLRQLHALRRLILETDASAENTLGQRDDLLEELQQLINEYSTNLAVREDERTERRPLDSRREAS
jgi:WD domain, G-beta repeat